MLKPDEAFATYRDIDCVLSFYDPSLKIHQFAEPNKWYDCLFTNTRIIVNSDIKASEVFINKFKFESVNYNDTEALEKKLITLIKFKQTKINYEHDFKTWDVSMRRVIDKI